MILYNVLSVATHEKYVNNISENLGNVVSLDFYLFLDENSLSRRKKPLSLKKVNTNASCQFDEYFIVTMQGIVH